MEKLNNMSNWQQRNYFWFLCDKKKNKKLTEQETNDYNILRGKWR